MATCDFSSARKRMSVIYRDPNRGIVLMCKGADQQITERLSEESKSSDVYNATFGIVNGFAREGLRTLYLAEKMLTEEEF